MNRRSFIIASSIIGICMMSDYSLYGREFNNDFEISLHGDLDDDLIIIKATPDDAVVKDIFQMHNPDDNFIYNGQFYKSTHIPGFINFTKKYNFEKEDEIFLVMLANEREEAHFSQRVRTHYKNEYLEFNNKTLLPSLMPEYNSIPNYPLWYSEDEVSIIEKKDMNNNQYNYYHLFDNTVIQVGIIFPREGVATIYLYDKNGNITNTYKEEIKKDAPKKLVSIEQKRGLFSSHPFAEVGNILNDQKEIEIPNDNYISNITIEFWNKTYLVPTLYPMMYPNLIFGVSNA